MDLDLGVEYTGFDSGIHKDRLVLPCFDGDWKVHVGKRLADGTYDMSAGVSMGLPSTPAQSEKGRLDVRRDNTLAFWWLDEDGGIHRRICRSLSLSGAGQWVTE